MYIYIYIYIHLYLSAGQDQTLGMLRLSSWLKPLPQKAGSHALPNVIHALVSQVSQLGFGPSPCRHSSFLRHCSAFSMFHRNFPDSAWVTGLWTPAAASRGPMSLGSTSAGTMEAAHCAPRMSQEPPDENVCQHVGETLRFPVEAGLQQLRSASDLSMQQGSSERLSRASA